MQIAVITYPGIEQYTAQEVEELLKVKTAQQKGSVLFSIRKPADVLSLCYKIQSGKHVMIVVAQGTFKEKEDIVQAANEKDLAPFIAKNTFAVRCERIGEHSFTSQEIEREIGKKIHGTVDLERPTVTILVILINDRYFIGIDAAGFDLSKRQYRIFSHGALKAPVGYALLRFAGYGAKQNMLDPFCADGLLAIEAAHHTSGFPLQHFVKERLAKGDIPDAVAEKIFAAEDKKGKKKIAGKIFCIDGSFANLKAAEKNAKIAGINKLITFSRMELDWLDTKFDKGSIDCIVTMIPQPNKRVDEKQMAKLYTEFFYQAEHVLKKNGCIVTELNSLLEDSAQKKGFAVEERMTVQQGGRVFVFGRMRRRK